MTIVDAGPVAIAGTDPAAGATAVVVVCRPTAPGMRRAEEVLGRVSAPALLTVVGPRKWPAVVTASLGPAAAGLRAAGRLVPIPIDPHLAAAGLTADRLPRRVLAAARAVLELIPALAATTCDQPRRADPKGGPAMTLSVAVLAVGPCPQAPPGMQTFADEIQSWIKWVVIALMAGAFVASIGMLVWGRVTHHPRGARIGFDGLIIVLVAAVSAGRRVQHRAGDHRQRLLMPRRTADPAPAAELVAAEDAGAARRCGGRRRRCWWSGWRWPCSPACTADRPDAPNGERGRARPRGRPRVGPAGRWRRGPHRCRCIDPATAAARDALADAADAAGG